MREITRRVCSASAGFGDTRSCSADLCQGRQGCGSVRPDPALRVVIRRRTGRPPRLRGETPGQCRHLDAYTERHYDAYVRTTLTLDPDVARLVDEAAHRARTSRKQVIN